MSAQFSDKELLALGMVGRQCPDRRQRVRQAELLAQFEATEPLPSSELLARKRWFRRWDVRRRLAARGTGAA